MPSGCSASPCRSAQPSGIVWLRRWWLGSYNSQTFGAVRSSEWRPRSGHMTTRDPRSRANLRPGDPAGAQRDPTQSLQIDPEDEVEPSHPSLALGTADAEAGREERTKIESPNARSRPPEPARPATRPPPVPKDKDDPDDRLGGVYGSYKIVELLGKGGMGYVYRAEHVKLGREVAIKLLRSDYAKRRDAVYRFIQE